MFFSSCRRRVLAGAVALLTQPAACAFAQATDFPSKPVTIRLSPPAAGRPPCCGW